MHVYNFRSLRTPQPRPIHSTHPVRQHTTKLKLGQLFNKIHVYFLLTEIPQQGKQGKRSPHSPNHQKPQICFQLSWTITKLIHVLIYIQAHPVKALQLTSTYQSCLQAQSWPNIRNKCLWYWIHLITVQKEHHHFSSSTSASPTQILLANRHVDHWCYSYLLQIATRISDQQIW